MDMELDLLIKGIILGFSVAAPIGPIGILCINRTMKNGLWSGFLTGAGAATADAIYAIIAGFGITAVSGFLLSQKLLIQLCGLVFLFYLGAKTFSEMPGSKEAKAKPGTLLEDYLTSLGLMIANPVTILFFLAVFTGLGLAAAGSDPVNSILLVAGVCSGSLAWWLILSGLTSVFRDKVKDKLGVINKLSGAIILLFGLAILFNLVSIYANGGA
ncbi:MAG TPA: LysE family transporter [Elusimicrobiales bacterium]|nr:LysE family transporter [Elusimicrobiales bacterium]